MGKVSNIINAIKGYFDTFLNPQRTENLEIEDDKKLEKVLRELCAKSHIPEQFHSELVRVAIGIKTGREIEEQEEEQEEEQDEKAKRTIKSDISRKNVQEVYNNKNEIHPQINQDSNNLGRNEIEIVE